MNAHRHWKLATLTLLGALSANAACAADQSIYGTIGPFGASIGYGQRLGDAWGGHWGSRVLINSGSVDGFKDDQDLSGNRYDTRLKTGPGISALLDYYPSLNSGWHASGGLILSRIKTDLKGQADAQGNYSINGHAYSAGQVGTLSGQLKYNPALLYVGGGWESAMDGAKGWRFVSDGGVFITGRAKTTLTSTNAATNPALQADLHAERDDLRKRGLGLMLQMGAAYAF